MTILDHEHILESFDGRLLFPEEIIAQGLDISKRYYYGRRCTIEGCNYQKPIEIQTLKIRGPRIYTGKKR